MSNYIDIASLRNISIVDFLARLGHYPIKKSGKEYFYHSMLRDTRKLTPSFTVWEAGGKWLDRGGTNKSGIQGGGIIQLAMAYWTGLSFVDVLNRVQEVALADTSQLTGYLSSVKNQAKNKESYHKFELIKTQPVGSNIVLTRYLEYRGVRNVAEDKLMEVYYRHAGSANKARVFYAVGWLNEHENWEFSSARGFKSSIGAKGISIVKGDPGHTLLFEGYMDYLSWLKENPSEIMPTIIVLNSITLLKRAADPIRDTKRIDVYLDNDPAGRNCTKELIRMVPHAVDRSYTYHGYKDYNEMVMKKRS